MEKKNKYLSCRDSINGKCKFMSFRYQDFEDAFLLSCHKIDLFNLINKDISKHEKQIVLLKERLKLVSGEINHSQKKVDNYTVAIGSDIGGSEDTIKHFISLIDQEKLMQRERFGLKQELERSISSLTKMHSQTEVTLERLKSTIQLISNATDNVREKIRRELQKTIRFLVERIDVYPRGVGYNDIIKIIDKIKDEQKKSEAFEIIEKNSKNHRSCYVHFRAGGFMRFIHDKKTNKLDYDIETDGHGVTRNSLDKIIELMSKNTSIGDLEDIFKEDMKRLHENNSN